MNAVPNLIIGGTPKSGTSSIYSWLCAHPEVSGSQPKEPFFLMDKDNPLMNQENNVHQRGIQGYQHFFQANPAKVRLEATTHYLYQQTALEVIAGLPSPPRVIFILRKPSIRLYSSFAYTLNNRVAFRKPLPFHEYVDILLSGKEFMLDDYIESDQSRYVLKRDLSYSNYSLYLGRWFQQIPAGKLHIFLFEDIIASPFHFMKNICNLLSIDAAFYDTYSFSKKNETFTLRNKELHKQVTFWAGLLPRGAIKKWLKKGYLMLQAKKPASDKHHQMALQKLDEYFAPYEQQLSQKFNLDITAWNKPAIQ